MNLPGIVVLLRHQIWGVVAVAAMLVGCGGGGGDSASTTEDASSTTPPAQSTELPPAQPAATALNIAITGVTVASPPVVNFTVTNQAGVAFPGLTTSDLRFNIAKLTPGSDGNTSTWQNYIVTTQTAGAVKAVQGTRENNGTLVDNRDGTYTYTFATDITNVSCPAPCTDAAGNALDLSYNPNLTHRLVIQTRGSLPAVNGVHTFRPSDGATAGLFTRDIVKTGSCNECHNSLQAHDARIDTKYCVTCHNPGSTDPNSGHTVDFKVMIHKIHRGSLLPSVVAGGDYAIIGHANTKHDFSDIVFPQDIRNCTKCHDGSDSETPDGDAWKTPTMAACGSCHDDIDYSKDGRVDPAGHTGGIITSNSECVTCHAEGRFAGSVVESHTNPVRVASARFQYNLISICGTPVGSDPYCGPESTPTVTFSVSDPTGGTHGYGDKYNILSDPEFTESGASLNIDIAWNTDDYSNDEGTGNRPARAQQINALTAPAVNNGDGTFTVTSPVAIPAGVTGTAVAAIEGHPRGPGFNVPVKGEVAYFGVTDTTPVARRVVVDVEAKCNKCHDQLTFHGGNRTDNAQLCVICHNARNTDAEVRPKTGGFPDSSIALDGKREEAIDFKRLIHGIHAGGKTSLDGTTALHGFREKGLFVYGHRGSEHDYSEVRFPGILNDCTTCHNPGTYELTGLWETPTQNGILSSTILSAPTAADATTFHDELADQTDDLTISPTAAVCSSCHDSDIAKAHMQVPGGAIFSETQGTISATVMETCAVCHGPGRDQDVSVVHGLQ